MNGRVDMEPTPFHIGIVNGDIEDLAEDGFRLE